MRQFFPIIAAMLIVGNAIPEDRAVHIPPCNTAYLVNTASAVINIATVSCGLPDNNDCLASNIVAGMYSVPTVRGV